MMGNVRKLWLFAVVSCAAITVLADPSVSDLRVRQRYPWNNLVDIEFTLSGASASGVELSFSVVDQWIPEDVLNVKTLVRATDKSQPVQTTFLNGPHHVLWKSDADLAVGQVYGGRVMQVLVGKEVKATSEPFAVDLDIVNGIRMFETDPYFFFSSNWNGSAGYQFFIDGKPVTKFRSYSDGSIYPATDVVQHKTSEFRLDDGIEIFTATGVVATVIRGTDYGAGHYWRLWRTNPQPIFSNFVYVVDGDFTITKDMTIPPGAVVKFEKDVTMTIAEGATLDARGAVLTSIDDATVGGDLNRDFGVTRPVPNGYCIVPLGTFVTNDLTRIRYGSVGASSEVVELAEDTYWAASEEHVIDCNLVVPDGITLEIEPGATVLFKRGASLTVGEDGTCLAAGVTFDAENGDAEDLDSYALKGVFTGDFDTEAKNLSYPIDLLVCEDVEWRTQDAPIMRWRLQLAEGCRLTIEPGTEVRFAAGAGLYLPDSTEVDVTGVSFRPLEDSEDAWYAIDAAGLVSGDLTTAFYDAWNPPYVHVTNDLSLTADELSIRAPFVIEGLLSLPTNAVVRFANGSSLDLRTGSCYAPGCTFEPLQEGGYYSINTGYSGGLFGTLATRVVAPAYKVMVRLEGDITHHADENLVVSGFFDAHGATLRFEEGSLVRFSDGASLDAGVVHAAGVTFAPQREGDEYVLKGTIFYGDPWTRFLGLEDPPSVYLDEDLEISADRETLICGYFVVPLDRTLTIAAGATVKLAQGSELEVLGRCVASGVTFEPEKADGAYVIGNRLWRSEGRGIFGDLATRFVGTDSAPVVHLTGEGLSPDATDIVINENLFVAEGETLTFVPGASVKVAAGVTLTILGECRADGVVFSPLTAGGSYGLQLGDSYIHGMLYGDFATAFDGAEVPARQKEFFKILLSRDLDVSAEGVTVVHHPFEVPADQSLRFAPGGVVKFADGASLDVKGICYAAGVTFTHLYDDTVGGDTDGDGGVRQPAAGAYVVSGNVQKDAATEFRYGEITHLANKYVGVIAFAGYNTYVVSNTVVLKSGADMTIGPGATFKFASGCGMTVESGAKLTAHGTVASPIVFTSIADDAAGGDTNGDSDATVPQPGDWRRVRVSGSATFEHVTFSYGGGDTEGQVDDVVTLLEGDLTLDGCVIEHALRTAVGRQEDNGSTLVMRNSVVRDAFVAFRHYVFAPVDNCVFYDCNHLYNNGGGWLRNCIVAGITTDWHSGAPFWGDFKYERCVFWNAGEGPKSLPSMRAGSAGNVFADPLFVDAANGDFRLKGGSPCIDAGDGTVAPALDMLGRPRMNARGSARSGVPDAAEVYPDVGVFEYAGMSAGGVPDLAVCAVSAPLEVPVGASMEITYTVTNRGTTAVIGTLRDEVRFRGAEAALGGVETVAGAIAQDYALEPGSAACLTASVKVPAMAAGRWRIGVCANVERAVYENDYADNLMWCERETRVQTGGFALGAGTATFAGGESGVYLLEIPCEGGTVRISASAAEALNRLSVYGGNGAVPSAERYDGAVMRTADGAWLVVLPPRNEGESAYLAVENSGAAVEADVRVEAAKLALYACGPNRIPNSGVATLTVSGSGFTTNSVFTLGGTLADKVELLDSLTALVTVDVRGKSAGAAALRVANGAESATFGGQVEIFRPTTGPRLEADLELPVGIRDGRVFAAHVVYANTGDEPMPMPVFDVRAGNDTTSLALAPDVAAFGSEVSVGGISPTAPADVLMPGETGRIPVYFKAYGAYDLQLELAVEDEQQGAYPDFGGVAAFLSAARAAAARLNLRGRRTYDVEDLYDQAYRELMAFPCAGVSGCLLDEASREPVAGVELSLVSMDGFVSRVTTGADGYFQFDDLSDGTYFFMPERNTRLASSSTNDVIVAGQRDVNGLALLCTAGARISGTVLMPDGSPAAGCLVSLYGDTGSSPRTAETDDLGGYSFSQLGDRTYRLMCTAEGGYYADPATNVTLDAVVRAQTVDFSLRVGGSICGTVTCGGEPVNFGSVYLTPEDGTPPIVVTCATNGEYRIAGAAPGTYSISFMSDRYTAEPHEVNLSAGVNLISDLVCEVRPLFLPMRRFGFEKLETRFLFTDRDRMDAIQTWAWDFDGDGQVDSTEPDPSWTYTTVGTNTVRLVIVDTNGVETVSTY